MKLNLVVSYLVMLLASYGASAWQLRRVTTDDVNRNLQQGFDFIVSEASNTLCMTAVEETKSYGSVELRACDFDGAPAEQLWSRQGNKFVSKLGDGNRCMTANHGNSLFDGVRIRLGNCNDGLTDFSWNDGNDDQLQVLSDPRFCLTPTGSTASSGDNIHAKPCLNRVDYRWTFVASAPTQEDDTNDALYQLYVPEANACVQPQNYNDVTAPIILGVCDEQLAWNVNQTPYGLKFSSRIDPTLCLQAGFCHATDGTWMRLVECDPDSLLQDFSWQDYDAPIKLADNDDLCMVYQGNSAEIGDIVIMKNCAVRTYEWNGILI